MLLCSPLQRFDIVQRCRQILLLGTSFLLLVQSKNISCTSAVTRLLQTRRFLPVSILIFSLRGEGSLEFRGLLFLRFFLLWAERGSGGEALRRDRRGVKTPLPVVVLVDRKLCSSLYRVLSIRSVSPPEILVRQPWSLISSWPNCRPLGIPNR